MANSDSQRRPPWWKGARGEWYVVGQAALFVLILFGPRHWPGLLTVSPAMAAATTVGGIVLLVAGAALMLAAFLNLGKSLTPLPYPKADGQLVERGAYRLVRHPIYSGGIAAAFGWALLVHGILTLGYAAVLLIFLDIKSRREERWLRAKYPAYENYAKRVCKLIPFIY